MASASASSSPLEFTLSLKPAYVPTSLNNLFTDLADIDYVPRKLIVLNEYVRKHEEELAKVEQFKRDLPQCRLLLLDAIQVLKDEILKLSGQEEYSDACHQSDRRSGFQKYKSSSPPFNPMPREKDQVAFQQGESRNGKAKERMVEREPMSPMPFPCTVNREASASETEPEPELELEEQRKQVSLSFPERWTSCKRRNWTPELHAGFLEATILLGGPKEATPKQIREIMQVEGLTNDQVKSHLQKYRLHNCTRVPAAAAGNAPQQALTRFIHRDFWNPSNTPQSNSNSQPPQQQEHEGGGRNGGGGSSSSGGWRSPENEERTRPKRSRLGDA